MTDAKPERIEPGAIDATMMRLLEARGAGRTLDPTEVARELGGPHPDGWGPLMQPIRQAAIRLAGQGRLVILRKGKPADPASFKGIYRLTLASGPGSSSDDLPVAQ